MQVNMEMFKYKNLYNIKSKPIIMAKKQLYFFQLCPMRTTEVPRFSVILIDELINHNKYDCICIVITQPIS